MHTYLYTQYACIGGCKWCMYVINGIQMLAYIYHTHAEALCNSLVFIEINYVCKYMLHKKKYRKQNLLQYALKIKMLKNFIYLVHICANIHKHTHI